MNEELATATDEQLLAWVIINTHWQNVYEPCTKEEYDAADPLDRVYDFKVVTTYDEPGIYYMMTHEPTGYRYEKVVGRELVCMVGSQIMDELNRRGLIDEQGQLKL